MRILLDPDALSTSGEGAPEEDGPIEAAKPSNEVRQEPYPLPKDFEWSVLDINDEKQVFWRFFEPKPGP
jgi:hypothetical protein